MTCTHTEFTLGEKETDYGHILSPWCHDIHSGICTQCSKELRIDVCVGRITGHVYSKDVIDTETCVHPIFIDDVDHVKTETWDVPIDGGLSFSVYTKYGITCARCAAKMEMRGNRKVLCHYCHCNVTNLPGILRYECRHSFCRTCKEFCQLTPSPTNCPQCEKYGPEPDYIEESLPFAAMFRNTTRPRDHVFGLLAQQPAPGTC